MMVPRTGTIQPTHDCRARSLLTNIDHGLNRQVRSQQTNICGRFTPSQPLGLYPTLLGHCIIAPRQHDEDWVHDLSEDQFVDQRDSPVAKATITSNRPSDSVPVTHASGIAANKAARARSVAIMTGRRATWSTRDDEGCDI
jgi:hypothetical protein